MITIQNHDCEKIKIGKNVKILEAHINNWTSIGDNVQIGKSVVIEENVKIQNGCIIEDGVRILYGAILHDHVHVKSNSTILRRSIVPAYSTVYSSWIEPSLPITIYYDLFTNKVKAVNMQGWDISDKIKKGTAAYEHMRKLENEFNYKKIQKS